MALIAIATALIVSDLCICLLQQYTTCNVCNHKINHNWFYANFKLSTLKDTGSSSRYANYRLTSVTSILSSAIDLQVVEGRMSF